MFRLRHLNHHREDYRKAVQYLEVLSTFELIFATPPNHREGHRLHNPLQNSCSVLYRCLVEQNSLNRPKYIVSRESRELSFAPQTVFE